VAEQFAFDQSFRQSRAIERHERAFAPRAVVMNGLGDEFFSGPALAGYQDGGATVGHLLDLRIDFLHRRAFADQIVKGIPLDDLRAQLTNLLF
jgi:hypothetical protein